MNKNDILKNKKSIIKKIFYSYDQSIDLPLIKLKNEIEKKNKNQNWTKQKINIKTVKIIIFDLKKIYKWINFTK